jgi:hypothetical protein
VQQPMQPIVGRHAAQARVSDDVLSQPSRTRVVETAPWPPTNQVASPSALQLGAPGSNMLGDR